MQELISIIAQRGKFACGTPGVTSVLGLRDTSCYETKYRYFKFKWLWFCERIKISPSFISVMLCALSRTPLARLFWKLRSRRRRPYDLRRASFHPVIGPLDSQRHHRALSSFKLIERLDLDFQVSPRCWEVIFSPVVTRECCVMRRRHMSWYLQLSD